MKLKNTIILFAAVMAIGTLSAQHLPNNIYVKDSKAWQSDNLLSVELTIDGSKAELGSQQAVILTPVVKSETQMIELEPVVVSGNKRYKATERVRRFEKKELTPVVPYAFVKKSDAANIQYSRTVPFEEWMQSAQIELKQELVGCPGCEVTQNWVALNTIGLQRVEVSKPDVQFAVSYIVPEAEPVKNRNQVGTAYLDFQVGKSVILTDFRNNFSELSKIQNDIDQLRNNKNATMTVIELKGFASPEGSYQTNARLSEARSQALKDYIQGKYGYSNSFFNVSSVAEDWDGLRKRIEDSYLSDKSAVLNIIDSPAAEDEKERRLKALPVYSTLLSEHFPPLRRVEYKLKYTVRAFSVDEGKEIVKVSPGQMSLNEMFLVANTYPKGSNDFNEVFDIAVRMFPQDPIANLNAAAIVLERGDATAAHRYLDAYKDDSRSWNNQGVLFVLEGDLAKAREYFTKAQASGSVEAASNLEKVKLLEEYENAKPK